MLGISQTTRVFCYIQITILLDNMLYLRNKQLYRRLLILAPILPIWDRFILRARIQVGVFHQMVQVSITTGIIANWLRVRYRLRLMLFLLWMSIIKVGITTIHLPSLWQAVESTVQISPQSRLWLRGRLGPIRIFQDWDLSDTHLLWAMGMSLRIQCCLMGGVYYALHSRQNRTWLFFGKAYTYGVILIQFSL